MEVSKGGGCSVYDNSHYILHQGQSSEYRGVGEKRLLMIQSSQGRETGRTLLEHVHAGSLSCLSYTFSLWYKRRDSLMNPPRNHSVCKTMAILVEGAERTTSVVRSKTGKPDKHWVPPPHLGTPGGCEANHFRSYSTSLRYDDHVKVHLI